ncbi:2-oxoacid:ferredoxin oxidoreductase subunit beta [Desulfotalea psychrophila]|uniref:Probable 2-oxoglutarate synthase, subunit KorB n=1 Tax=Desulfotalea psychrophila (strain LSv54 / DSM 12343) TaxID=177439 RepID=Q6APV4_DESPS|nr:2-oxoacid:ferredoxin oxidoreductase subunit beta [Desulfotalea psychrophila]CAG35620.1 probable 2-oxoglutarate synthase, subunit KorB [Desulfotalea psychrophila LSv54]
MTTNKPIFHHPKDPLNALGYRRKDYEGAASTLCPGCGHDSVTNAIIQACFEMNIPPHQAVKVSGIGCSSKTPTYFLGRSHGFNSVHGRMPSVAMGAHMSDQDLLMIGISGDGDTASIGMGQFAHIIRRNPKLSYIVMNNGCYGLTKGQDSATADRGSASRKGKASIYESIDLCELALSLGATFVARSFSGDRSQLEPLLKAAFSHNGLAFLDVISPCITFNNNAGSTKSYEYVRAHIKSRGNIKFIAAKEEEQSKENGQRIKMDNGSQLLLPMNPERDVRNRLMAMQDLLEAKEENRILTGLLYIEEGSQNSHQLLNTCKKSLNSLQESELCPKNKILQQINQNFR